ncbi:hypothetical protein KU43P_33150 [Pseudomonas sp. KU43P]|nr:hypothetical protein KU43P_33150 [Pseudomonas sp. KU43P]
MEKERVLRILKPHMFFDDQRSHLKSAAGDLPMVHVPFGVANRGSEMQMNEQPETLQTPNQTVD